MSSLWKRRPTLIWDLSPRFRRKALQFDVGLVILVMVRLCWLEWRVEVVRSQVDSAATEAVYILAELLERLGVGKPMLGDLANVDV